MDIFQGFALGFLFLFFLTFFGRTVLLTLQGVKVVVLGEGKKGFARLLELALFIGLFIWTYEVINYAFQWNHSVLPGLLTQPILRLTPFQTAGLGIIVMGYIVFVAALISFGTSWRVGVDKEGPGELVTTGVFSLSRNPVFVFIDLYFFGMWLIVGNLFFLVSAVAVIGAMHYQVLQEERFLNEHYGERYIAYQNRVRRYF